MSKPVSLTNLHAETIDGVIDSLDRVIAWSKENGKRIGYFTALYRKVTVKVKQGIEQNHFDDGQRMERLDVIFANRYLDAFEAYYAGKPVTECWRLAFEIADRWYPLVLQHLMLGMNAHINLDLGIAAAETVAAEQLKGLKPDFEKINDVLADLIDEVEHELGEIWPLFSWLDSLAGRLDEKLADKSMIFARDQAWAFAVEYALSADKSSTIDGKDKKLYLLGLGLIQLSFLRWSVFLLIRLGELGSVKRKIEILE